MKTIIVRLQVESTKTSDYKLREAICSVLSGLEQRHRSVDVRPDKTETLRHDVHFRIACVKSGQLTIDSGT